MATVSERIIEVEKGKAKRLHFNSVSASFMIRAMCTIHDKRYTIEYTTEDTT